MPNSFMSSLSALDISSVTDSRSILMYGAWNGASKLLDLATFSNIIGENLSTFIVRSSNPTTTASVFTIVPYDYVVRDPFGLYDANSVGTFYANFNGYARINYGITGGAIHDSNKSAVFKNGALFRGGGPRSYNDAWTIDGSWSTHVFTVTSGDYFDIRVIQNGDVLNSAGGELSAEFVPIALNL